MELKQDLSSPNGTVLIIPSISVGNEKTAAFVVTVNTINLEEDSKQRH